MSSRTPAITIVEPSIHDGDDLSTFRSAPCLLGPLWEIEGTMNECRNRKADW